MYFVIYKTTNKQNGMIYIGKHQTENVNDSYLGSGRRFTGTQWQLRNEFNLEQASVCHMIKGKYKTSKGWRLGKK